MPAANSTEPITSAEAFTDGLRDVVDRYMMHLEPSADAQLYAVKMDVVGERLNITFNKAPGQTPYIAFTLQSSGDTDTTTTASGLLWRRS